MSKLTYLDEMELRVFPKTKLTSLGLVIFRVGFDLLPKPKIKSFLLENLSLLQVVVNTIFVISFYTNTFFRFLNKAI